MDKTYLESEIGIIADLIEDVCKTVMRYVANNDLLVTQNTYEAVNKLKLALANAEKVLKRLDKI